MSMQVQRVYDTLDQTISFLKKQESEKALQVVNAPKNGLSSVQKEKIGNMIQHASDLSTKEVKNLKKSFLAMIAPFASLQEELIIKIVSYLHPKKEMALVAKLNNFFYSLINKACITQLKDKKALIGKELHIYNNRLNNGGENFEEILKVCPLLKKLDLSRLTDPQIQDIIPKLNKYSSELTHLKIPNHSNLLPTTLMMILFQQKLPGLVELEVESTALSGEKFAIYYGFRKG